MILNRLLLTFWLWLLKHTRRVLLSIVLTCLVVPCSQDNTVAGVQARLGSHPKIDHELDRIVKPNAPDSLGHSIEE
jgi:hypothetical protein